MESEKRGNKKVLRGVVISDRMDKTVQVLVERLVQDQKYKKYVKRRKKFMAHDEKNECRVGDEVEIIETRPLSRHKRFRVIKILKRGASLGELASEVAQNQETKPEGVSGNDSK